MLSLVSLVVSRLALQHNSHYYSNDDDNHHLLLDQRNRKQPPQEHTPTPRRSRRRRGLVAAHILKIVVSAVQVNSFLLKLDLVIPGALQSVLHTQGTIQSAGFERDRRKRHTRHRYVSCLSASCVCVCSCFGYPFSLLHVFFRVVFSFFLEAPSLYFCVSCSSVSCVVCLCAVFVFFGSLCLILIFSLHFVLLAPLSPPFLLHCGVRVRRVSVCVCRCAFCIVWILLCWFLARGFPNTFFVRHLHFLFVLPALPVYHLSVCWLCSSNCVVSSSYLVYFSFLTLFLQAPPSLHFRVSCSTAACLGTKSFSPRSSSSA